MTIRRILLRCGILWAFMLSAIVASNAAEPATVTFSVRDRRTNEAVEYAAVTVSADSTEIRCDGYTDAAGNLVLKLQPGKWHIDITAMGYKPYHATETIDKEIICRYLISPGAMLNEVVVTAQEGRSASSVSVIDSMAMRHLQPSSFTDLLELLPGGVSKDPEMGSVNTIALRTAANVSTTDDYATSALGTSFVVDGVPLNTGSQMQTTPDADQTDRISVGKGVDMRSIATDDIEKVEVVRGIASAEYGEMTSGVVKIKRKSGVSRIEARFKADTQSQLFYLGKGFAMPVENWTVNVGINYLDSKIDPRNNRENFKRVGGLLRSNKRWHSDVATVLWSSSFDYTMMSERDNEDPDLTVNNTIDDYSNSEHTFKWNNTVSVTPSGERVLRDVSFVSGISYAYEHLSQRKHVAPSRIMPQPVSTTAGSNYVGYLPMLYIAEYDVYGKPFSAFAKMSARLHADVWRLSVDVRGGVEWSMNKNYGRGKVYDLSRPLTAGNNTRPRSFDAVPAMHQLSAYGEADMLLTFGVHTVKVTAGVRETQLLNLGSSYALNGKPYLDPRVNVVWRPGMTYIGEYPIVWELAGGYGVHTKMPVAAYLYPELLYTDLEQLNYYHNEAAYRVMNVKTFIEDLTNYDLLAARNRKWEIRGDINYRGNRLSVTYFRENMTDGFRSTGTVHRYEYNKYDASAYDPYATGHGPTIEELPSVATVYQAVRSTITNGSRTGKWGVEYTLQTKRFPIIRTRLTVTGAYLQTTNNNSQALWYKPSIVANGKELQYVGLYDDTDGSVYRSFNTNFLFDTDIPDIALNVSLGVQNMWFTSRRTLYRDGIPTYYMDPDGNIHPYTEASLTDPYLSQLVRNYSNATFEETKVPIATTINLKATKSFWKDRICIAMYVNRLFAIQPDYESYGVTMRRYSSPYFGMEINLKL